MPFGCQNQCSNRVLTLASSLEMITVYVKLFGNLRRRLPESNLGEPTPVKTPAGTTVSQLTGQLQLPAAKLIFVNGVAQKKEFVLRDQDQLTVIPPMGGG